MAMAGVIGAAVAIGAATERGGRCRQHPGATERGDWAMTCWPPGAAMATGPLRNCEGGWLSPDERRQ
jgi:hypothetical protein